MIEGRSRASKYRKNTPYPRESFAINTNEGKTYPSHKMYSYHTKMLYLAIVPPIFHYTEPSDVMLDGFREVDQIDIVVQSYWFVLISEYTELKNVNDLVILKKIQALLLQPKI